VRMPPELERRLSTFHTTLPASEPTDWEFSVAWYEPKTLPANRAALRWQGADPTSLENAGRPVAPLSICCAAPSAELLAGWNWSFGPFAETIASRVGGLSTPKKPTQRFGAAGAKIVEKSPAAMSGSVRIVVALRNVFRSPRSTMYSGPAGLFWYAT